MELEVQVNNPVIYNLTANKFPFLNMKLELQMEVELETRQYLLGCKVQLRSLLGLYKVSTCLVAKEVDSAPCICLQCWSFATLCCARCNLFVKFCS